MVESLLKFVVIPLVELLGSWFTSGLREDSPFPKEPSFAAIELLFLPSFGDFARVVGIYVIKTHIEYNVNKQNKQKRVQEN